MRPRLFRRWGTRKGIQTKGGTVLEHTGADVDASVVGREHEGLTNIDYDPQRP